MPWTNPTTRTVGELITAAKWNTDLTDNLNVVGPHLLARKTADETVNNSAVQQDDDHLFTPTIAANEVWWLVWVFTYRSDTTPDLRFQFTFPTSGTISAVSLGPGAFNTIQSNTSPSAAIVVPGVGGVMPYGPVVVNMYYINSSVAGVVKMQWAQDVANASDTTVKANSALWGVKLA